MRKYLIALLISAAIIAAFFALLEVMHWRMEFYITHGVEIPLWERILVSIAKLWAVFWPELSLFIVFGSLGVAHFLHFMELARTPSNKGTGSS